MAHFNGANMKVYLAGEREIFKEGNVTSWGKVMKRRLFSYYYNGALKGNQITPEIWKTLDVTDDLFLDSGAFSAYTKGVTLNVDKYASFIHQADIWSCASNLDDIRGDSQLTYDNQKALESLGCKVQPVFHSREEPRWLTKYLDEGYDYIFIGGMVPETTKFLHEWLDFIWGHYLTKSDGTPRVKVHGFGLTTVELMIKYPWYSVDSSTWLMTGIFGSCIIEIRDMEYMSIPFSKDSPRRRDETSRHYYCLSKHEKSIVDSRLAEIGVSAKDCIEHYYYRDIVNAYTFQNMERHGIDKFHSYQMGLFDV